MKKEELEILIEKCLSELNDAYNGKCSAERAEKNAALFLEVQLRISDFIADVDLKAKLIKNEVERLSSEKYFYYKDNAEKKLTEAALDHSVNKDQEIFSLKKELIASEIDTKKWTYVLNILSNGHIYYRNLGKREYGV